MTRSNGFRKRLAAVMVAAAASAGCRSDLNQQLLERELRLQEDQIYQLQDELQFKASRLDRIAVENASLKKQLGIVDADASLPSKTQPPPGIAEPARPAAAPSLSPPAVEFVPPPRTDGPPAAGGGAAPPASRPAVPVQPPTLDGVPPLPGSNPGLQFRGTSLGPSRPADGPVFGSPAEPPPRPIDPTPAAAAAAEPSIRRLSYEESLADESGITHIVINASRSGLIDADGDGRPDGLAVVFEPRDADERLVNAAGEVFVAAFDAAAPLDAPPVATWQLSAREAVARFRPTSRTRGLNLELPWPDRPPASGKLRLQVRMTTSEGQAFEREATLAE
jgi:hypothetical protein